MKNYFTTLLLFLITGFGSFAQITLPDRINNESFENLTDSIIKQELATFTIAGTMNENISNADVPKLEQIPLLSCSNNRIAFERGNFISTNLHVSIESTPFDATQHEITYVDSLQQWVSAIDQLPVWGCDGNLPKKQITAINFWFHIHWQQYLPDSALAGLYEPNFCSQAYQSWKKPKQPEPENLFCAVYQSKDKKRVYIYMLNGDGAGGYEVTWIIEDFNYKRRVIDYGF